MHTQIYRSILLAVGFILAWAAVLAGNGMHGWALTVLATGDTLPLIITTVLSTVILVVGIFFLAASMAVLGNESVPSAIAVAVVAVCFAFVFGAVGAVSSTGEGLRSAWVLALLLGFLPMTIAVCELIVEIRARQLEQKKPG